MFKTRLYLLLVSTLCFAPLAQSAEFTLNNDKSQLNFISTKNNDVSEIHSFDQLSGSISKEGKLEILVAMDSVNTLIPIRDDRMKGVLFEIVRFPNATFTATIPDNVMNMVVGHSIIENISGQLTIKDSTSPMSFEVRITKLANGKLQATTVKPSLLHADKFKLAPGLQALQTIAKLQNISKVVPITFSVVFE